jgi:hypothetical protein
LILPAIQTPLIGVLGYFPLPRSAHLPLVLLLKLVALLPLLHVRLSVALVAGVPDQLEGGE